MQPLQYKEEREKACKAKPKAGMPVKYRRASPAMLHKAFASPGSMVPASSVGRVWLGERRVVLDGRAGRLIRQLLLTNFEQAPKRGRRSVLVDIAKLLAHRLGGLAPAVEYVRSADMPGIIRKLGASKPKPVSFAHMPETALP